MNLIEQLGGYEQAKEIAFDPLHPQMTHVSIDGCHWVNEEFAHIPEINEQMKGMVKIGEIRHALLEYRRANNIYEAGDKVVRTHSRSKPKIWAVEGVSNVFLKHYVCDADGELLEHFSEYEIRHATDEEIEAGKRLGGAA